MMRFDRKKFFDGYRQAFGRLSVIQVSGLNQLLDFIEADPFITRIPWAAYELATVKHETADTFHPIHEYGGKAYFVKRYGGQTRKGKELGNDTPDEGYYYAGKGYSQTTGETNYEKAEKALRTQYPEIVADFERRTGKTFDLTVGDQPNDEQDPANMMDPAIAYATMSYGMRTGMFTGHKMSEYLNSKPPDYIQARRIINGKDKAATIAGYARKFEKILNSAASSNAQTPTSETENSNHLAETPLEPNSGAADTQQGEVKKTVFQSDEGGGESKTITQSANVAVGAEEQVGFFQKIKKELMAWFAWFGGLAGLNEYKQQIDGLGLPGWIILYALLGSVLVALIWIIYRVIAHLLEWWGKRKRTDVLAQVNATPTNSVVIVPQDQLDAYEKAGWIVIRRGPEPMPPSIIGPNAEEVD